MLITCRSVHTQPAPGLLRFADIDTGLIEIAATQCGLPLDVIDIRDAHARAIYERELVFVRPDQRVAWHRRALPKDPSAMLGCVRGTQAHA